jgi:membrane-bound lytic murein transglycosylase D
MKYFFILVLVTLAVSGCSSQTVKPQAAEQATQVAPTPIIPVIDQWSSTDSFSDSEPQEENLWPRILRSFSLNTNIENARITAQLNWYKRHQGYLDRMTDRARRYMFYIAEQIEVRNVPGELALLPIVESAFDPFAYSHGRASGVWQFIPSTGRDFGLKQDWWYDGRRDIRASTVAALKYLEALQREFKGDWLLALASYNTGAGNVRKAIRKNKRRGKPTDFWSLDLPRETKAYVPKLIALAKLFKEPARYGVTLKPLANEPYFDVVDTGGQIDLAQLADFADTDLEEIYKLNPGFNRWATSPTGPHKVLVPIEKTEILEQNLTSLPPEARLKWKLYRVKKGDSLITIAKKHHTTPEALKQANSIRRNLIRAGDQILIPTASRPLKSYSHSANSRLAKIKNTARGKRSLKTEYRVQSGDSFWDIARSHKVGVRELAKWNGMAPGDTLKQGQKLVIWTANPKGNQREVIRKLTYTVRNGDSLARIAGKFNVRVSDIKRWNRKKTQSKYLQPGQRLTLYVDVTN